MSDVKVAKKKTRRRIATATSSNVQSPSEPALIKRKKSLRSEAYSPEDNNNAISTGDASTAANGEEKQFEQRTASSSPRLPRSQSLLASTPQTALATYSVTGVLPSPRTEEAEKQAADEDDAKQSKSLLSDSWPSIPRLPKTALLSPRNFDVLSLSPHKESPLTVSQRLKIKEKLLAGLQETPFVPVTSGKVLFQTSSSVELDANNNGVNDDGANAPSPRGIRQRQITQWLKSVRPGGNNQLRRTKSLAHPLAATASEDENSEHKKDKDCVSEGAIDTIHKLKKSTSDEKKKQKPTTVSSGDDAAAIATTKLSSSQHVPHGVLAERHDSGSSSSDIHISTQSTSSNATTSAAAGSAEASLEEARGVFSMDNSSSSEKSASTAPVNGAPADRASPRRKSIQIIVKNMLSLSSTNTGAGANADNNTNDVPGLQRVHSYSHKGDSSSATNSPRSPNGTRSPRQVSLDAVRQQQRVASGHSLIIFNSSAIVGDKSIRRYLVPNWIISISMRFALQRAVTSNSLDPLRLCECKSLQTKGACSEHNEYSVDMQTKFPIIVMLDKQYIRNMHTPAKSSTSSASAKVVSPLEKFYIDYPDATPGAWSIYIVKNATQTDFTNDCITHIYQLRAFV